jgi:hypothetical protein
MSQRSASYRLSGVKLDRTKEDDWIVRPATPAWFIPVVGGGVLTVIGIGLLSIGSNGLLLSVFLFSSALYFLITYPLAAEARFDFSARELKFTAAYLLRFSRRIDWSVPFTQIASLGLRPQPFGKSHIAQLRLQDGAELVMDFGQRVAEAEQFVQRFSSTAAPTLPVVSGAVSIAPQGDAVMADERLQRTIRSWGTWLIVMGVIEMLTVRGVSPWGVVLIIVGAVSFYFREAPMLIVYAVTISWAGLNNLLLTTSVFWKGFAILQALIIYLLFRQFWQFRQAEKRAAEAAPALPTETLPASAPTRTERWFPWFTLLLGGVAVLLFIAALVGAFILRNRDLFSVINLLETLAVNMAVLGLATGLASWLSIASNKWVAIVGCVASGLTLAVELALPILLKTLS